MSTFDRHETLYCTKDKNIREMTARRNGKARKYAMLQAGAGTKVFTPVRVLCESDHPATGCVLRCEKDTCQSLSERTGARLALRMSPHWRLNAREAMA